MYGYKECHEWLVRELEERSGTSKAGEGAHIMLNSRSKVLVRPKRFTLALGVGIFRVSAAPITHTHTHFASSQ